ncbi:MAG: hypothetical protein NVSMB32_11520 [Actinomycetota bacterium]
MPGSLHLVRVRVWREGGRLVAGSAGSQGAGMVHSLARANGWAVIAPGDGPPAAGDEVDIRMIGEVWEWDPLRLGD